MSIKNQNFDEYTYSMASLGFYKIENLFSLDFIDSLRFEMDKIFEFERAKFDDYEKESRFCDIIHCLISRPNCPSAIELFQSNKLLKYIELILGETCIMHSYNALMLNPFKDNNAGAIHRDTPRFYENSYPLSIQALLCIDPFNEETGATYLLPGSHRVKEKPSDKFFYDNAVRFKGNPGDVLLFDSLVWHRAGANISKKPRRGVTLVYTRSFMKQQIDLMHSISEDIFASLNETGKRLAGANVVPPKSVEEFFLPEEKRTYKSGQG